MICINCSKPFEDHDVKPGGNRACREGGTAFNFEFEINPKALEFVRENLDKTPHELATLWIEKLRRGEV